MTTAADRWRAVSARLDEALAIDSPAARAEYVARLRDQDASLAEEVEALLAASVARDELLDADLGAVAAQLVQPLPEAPALERIGPWQVLGVLGEGGMGVVYAAERRGEGFVQRAAVKRLSAGAARGELHERFLAERRILARLEHPGIARMLDGGVDADGVPYLAMELVEGATLTAACRDRRATVEDRIALFLGVCAAVEHAHKNLVVHRDLKPSNVMVDREGRVKLLDFGIAKLLEPEADASAPPTLLRAMTPQYAAPEQAAGGAITPATDVYALGVLLHELLAGVAPREATGDRPFTVERALAGANAATLAHSARVDASRPEGDRLARRLAGDLERIVERAMRRDPERRYPSAGALAEDLRRHTAGRPIEARRGSYGYRAGRWAQRHRRALAAGAFALGIGALGGQLLRERLSSTAAPSGPVVEPATPVVAVLSFAPLGATESFLATALSEGVATELGRTPGLAVLASPSVAGIGEDDASLARLATELGATHAVRGSVQTEGETVRLQVALLDLASRRTVWAGHLDGEAGARLATQAELARRTAWELLERLGGGATPRRDEVAVTHDPRAYEAYLRGLAVLSGRTAAGVGPEQRLAATVQFELAVALDPGFAEAWARLGTVYAKRLYHDEPSPDLEARSLVAIQRALALDPEVAEAYLARAQLFWTLPRGFDHARAVADLRRALALHPSLAEAHQELCKVYFHVGLTDRAVAECDRALALDPRDRTAFGRKVSVLADAGRDAEVAALLEARGRELSPGIRAGMLVDVGRNEEALGLLLGEATGARPRDTEFGWPSSSRAALERIWAAIALARLGRREEAAAQLSRAEFTAETVAEESHLHHAYYFAGAAHALLGNRDEALRWLTRAADEGYPSYPRFARDGDLASLAGDSRFVALLARMERDWQRWQREL